MMHPSSGGGFPQQQQLSVPSQAEGKGYGLMAGLHRQSPLFTAWGASCRLHVLTHATFFSNYVHNGKDIFSL
jgi:hypothetical protein